jgi:hypothetical protein
MSIQTKLAKFNFVTVMNPTFYSVNVDGSKNAELFTLDSLRVANLTQEGPTKTAKGGLYANTKLRYGKTMRLEMEDVMGRISALQYLMGVTFADAGAPADVVTTETFTALAGQTTFVLSHIVKGLIGTVTILVDGSAGTNPVLVGANAVSITATSGGEKVEITYTYTSSAGAKYSITDKFADAVWIEGETFVIDGNGDKQWVKLVIPSFLPDSTFNISLESEGDIGVININGDVQANECGEFMWFEDDTGAHTC